MDLKGARERKGAKHANAVVGMGERKPRLLSQGF